MSMQQTIEHHNFGDQCLERDLADEEGRHPTNLTLPPLVGRV